MSFANRANRLTLDAFSDAALDNTDGTYAQFTNRLTTPILNAKGIQLLSCNLVNSSLQLNDLGHLMFFYYASSTQASIATSSNLKCVRLHPSNFVPYAGFTSFTLNSYFNTVQDVVTQLNAAASTGGDSVTYNPFWLANGVIFSYNSGTRRISVQSGISGNYIAPAAFDDPLVQAILKGTATSAPIKMNTYNSSNTYATAKTQLTSLLVTMNSRLGFTLDYYARGFWWNTNSQLGCATSTGVPQLYGTVIPPDTTPILLGSQNVNIYADVIVGGGMDSLNNKNLLCSIPISAPALNVIPYTASGVKRSIVSLPNEIYSITIYLLDDQGLPFVSPTNYNVQIALAVFY